MSCFIRDRQGKTIYAEANNGERSILFDELRKRTPDNAEDLYTVTVTEDFLEEVVKPRNVKVKKSIIGQNMAKMIDDAEGTNKVKSLNDARYLESTGKTPLQIKKITGWERGVDSLWRYEIPDGSIDLTGVEINKIYNISQIIKDNYITKLYPDIKIVFKDEPFKGTEASYNRAKKTIEVQTRSLGNNNEPLVNNGRWDSQTVFSLISHELVHFAQQIEGFDGGGDLYSIFNRAKEIILEQNAQGKDDITSLKNVLKKNLKRNDRNIIEGVIEYLEENSPSKKENLTGTFKSNGVTINYRPRINPITNQQLGGIELELINTPQDLRGQGRAKKALREFLLMTDREGQDVYLFASPRDKTTTEKGLINFYRSLGFTSDQFLPQEMVRRARNVNRTPKPIAAQFDKNGEVFAKDVYEYVDRKNAEGIVPTQEDRVNIIKALDAQTPSSDALLERTRKAFYRNGLFSPTMSTLTNNGYTKGEATNILSDLSLQAQIKENIAKIQNLKEPISIDEVEMPYSTISSMEPNFVGKYQQANPYIAQKQIVDTLGGIKDRNEFDSAVVENSMEVAKNDFEDLSQYTELTIKEVQLDGTITERKLHRTAEKFQETLTDPTNDDLRKEIDYILNIPPDIAQTSQSEITDLLEELREKAVDIGLDLTDIGQKYTEKGIGELTRFLVALRTLNAQNLQNFAQVYDSFFDIDTETVETEKIKGATQTTEKIYNKQKTAFEMFAENGLLYQGNNLYKRTNNRKSLEETLDIIEKRPEMFPQEIFDGINMTNTAQVRDRIENYANEQVQEIETGGLFDADKLKVYFLNTVYFGTPTNIQENIKNVENIVGKEIDTQYLSTDFIADFNKRSLKEKIKGSQKYRDFYSNFNITKDGIEPINTDPLSIQIMEEYMDEYTRNYFSLKKDSNVFAQVEEPSYVDDVLSERNRVINFPKSLPLYKGQFEQKSARTIKVKNPTENFIRTRDGVYELTEKNSTDGYYAKLPHNTSPYILLTDMVPEIDVEMDNAEQVKESEIKISKLYTKQEEQQINSELECG